MLHKVEDIARQRGCCKITLEVLEGNGPAQASYTKFGFAPGEFDPAHGRMMFWIKPLIPLVGASMLAMDSRTTRGVGAPRHR